MLITYMKTYGKQLALMLKAFIKKVGAKPILCMLVYGKEWALVPNAFLNKVVGMMPNIFVNEVDLMQNAWISNADMMPIKQVGMTLITYIMI